MIVYINETTVEKHYESKEFKSLTNSLDSYLDVEGMELSKDEKLVLDKIFDIQDRFGIYKKLLLNEFDIKLGLNGEISRVYGNSLYIKPSLGLNLG